MSPVFFKSDVLLLVIVGTGITEETSTFHDRCDLAIFSQVSRSSVFLV
jgi:hypothetical protein